jgi:membrane protein
MLKKRFLFFFQVVQEALQELLDNDPLRLGAATAFFTIFALPPILIIFINLFGSVFSSASISEELNLRLQLTFGPETATLLTQIIFNVLALKRNPFLTFTGSVFLVFVATTLFIIVQNSINQLWGIRTKKRSRYKKVFFQRLKSFLIIMATGFLFLFSLLFDFMSDYIGPMFHDVLAPVYRLYTHEVISTLVSLLLVTLWFGITFQYLPNARVKWRQLWVGAFVTAVLFTGGRYMLSYFLVNENLGLIYGPAASVILILLFIFYASLILYFGACFIKTYSAHTRQQIEPKFNATRFKIIEYD